MSHSYNANGIRTSKTIYCYELHEYVLEGSKILKESWNGNSLIPLYDNTDSVCGIIYNGISYFFLKNLQGDIIAITNSDGETVARYSYDAWGKCTIDYDDTGYIADINPFRYRGYYFDKETKLYYLNSRYCDANTGRFINADSPEYVSIQGGNLFAYGGNCPTKNADYFGFCYVPTYPESYVPNNSGSTAASSVQSRHFEIPAWTVATAIDLAVALMNPIATTTYSTLIGSIWGFLKLDFAQDVAIRLIRAIVPKVVGVLSGLLTIVRQVIWKIAGVTLYFLTNGLLNAVLNEIDFWIFNILDLFSIGGIMSFMLDKVTDDVINDKIRLW